MREGGSIWGKSLSFYLVYSKNNISTSNDLLLLFITHGSVFSFCRVDTPSQASKDRVGPKKTHLFPKGSITVQLVSGLAGFDVNIFIYLVKALNSLWLADQNFWANWRA